MWSEMAESEVKRALLPNFSALSDQGMRRTNNQDAHVEVAVSDEDSWLSRGHLFIVADGMGAHAAGELASEMACQRVSHQYYKYLDLPPPEALKKSIENANQAIHQRGQENPEFHNMGTTISSLVLLPQGAILGHVGDSRVYRLRADKLSQLTFDHSLVWELRRSGQLPSDGSKDGDVPSNVITRSLGPQPQVQVDVEGPFDIQLGDVFLLCSDGLCGPVPESEYGPALRYLEPAKAAQYLIDTANIQGGPDNITVTIIKVDHESMVSDSAQAIPVPLKQARGAKGTHPAFWAGGVVGLLAGLGMYFSISPLVGGILALLGAVSLVAAIVQPLVNSQDGVSYYLDQKLGGGPYVERGCEVSRELLAAMVQRTKELRQLSASMPQRVDWQTFDEYCLQGAEREHERDLVGAYRQFAQAILFVMQEFRSSGDGTPQLSSADRQ